MPQAASKLKKGKNSSPVLIPETRYSAMLVLQVNKWSLERALIPRPAAYEAAALPG